MFDTKSQTSYEAILWLIACAFLIGKFRGEVNAPYVGTDGQSYLEIAHEAGWMSPTEDVILGCCPTVAVVGMTAFCKATSTHVGIRGSRP
jgi:hypothetical protein